MNKMIPPRPSHPPRPPRAPAPAEVFVVDTKPLPLGPRLDELARCAHCRFAVQVDQRFFECHRHTPANIERAGALEPAWPVMCEDDWCGEYWPRAPLHVDDAIVQARRACLAHEAALDAMQAAAVKRREEKHNVSTTTGRKVLTVKSSMDGATVLKVTTP